jgi:hypothetical protein
VASSSELIRQKGAALARLARNDERSRSGSADARPDGAVGTLF